MHAKSLPKQQDQPMVQMVNYSKLFSEKRGIILKLNYNQHLKGMNKMVINHLEKLFVTNDAATMMREIEVCFIKLRCKNKLNKLRLFLSNQDPTPSS